MGQLSGTPISGIECWHMHDPSGSVIGHVSYTVFAFSKVMTIVDLQVYPAYRNKGYGTKIVQDLVEQAKHKGLGFVYAHVDADNPDAQRFFSRLGTVSDVMNEDGRYMVTLLSAQSQAGSQVSSNRTKPKATMTIDDSLLAQAPSPPITAGVLNAAPVKDIDFPIGERPYLVGQDEIITHRVGRDFNEYNAGDTVLTPWGDIYAVVSKQVECGPSESPYKNQLTKEQFDQMACYPWVSILKLRRITNGLDALDHKDDDSVTMAMLNNIHNYLDFKVDDVKKQLDQFNDYGNLSKDEIMKQIDELLDDAIKEGECK